MFIAHGLPLAIYGDRLNILVRNDPHWSLEEHCRARSIRLTSAGSSKTSASATSPPVRIPLIVNTEIGAT